MRRLQHTRKSLGEPGPRFWLRSHPRAARPALTRSREGIVPATIRFLTLCSMTLSLLTATGRMSAAEVELPVGSHPEALPTPHFPTRLHAFVWRNWSLVDAGRLAHVLQTTPDKVTAIATSMGLPPQGEIPKLLTERAYITIVRRNWHLLPYDQLLTLLNIPAEEFRFRLQEDDFLFIKLGSLKPRCAQLTYEEPDPDVLHRTAEIRALVEQTLGSQFNQPGEPRFAFINDLGNGSETTSSFNCAGIAPRVGENLPRPPAHALQQEDGDADVVSQSSLSQPARAEMDDASGPRFIYSYFGTYGDPLSDTQLDPYPAGLLERLHDVGVNGVWLHTVLRQLAPGGPKFPEFGEGHTRRLANLRRIVERARRYNIGVYLYVNEPRTMPVEFFRQRPELAGIRAGEMMTLCTSQPAVREWISNSLEYVFREVPDLAGVFTISASENLTNCWSHFQPDACPRCRERSEADVIAEVNRAIEQGVHAGNPAANVIVWDWGWNRHGESPETIQKLPKNVYLQSVSEWALPIVRGGVHTQVGEYSLSSVGPGPRALSQWAVARECGLRTSAKVQLNATWELASLPYLPVLDLVAEHCENLSRASVDGMMLSWTVGGYPSLNLRVADLFAQQPKSTAEDVLDRIAREAYGPDAAPLVRSAWTAMSQAFRHYPYHGAVVYRGPQQMGPANLLHARPTGYTSTMVGFPYDDLTGWRGPYPAETFADQFQQIADGWQKGLEDLGRAIQRTPPPLRAQAEQDARIARAAQVHFASVANQARFVITRDRWLQANQNDQERERLSQELTRLLDDEIRLARELFPLARDDSRIGFEASNHYFYLPIDLAEKILNCRHLQDELAAGASRE